MAWGWEHRVNALSGHGNVRPRRQKKVSLKREHLAAVGRIVLYTSLRQNVLLSFSVPNLAKMKALGFSCNRS